MNALKNNAHELVQETPPPVTKEELQKLCDIWKNTLKHFKINRPVLSFELMKISQLAKSYGFIATAYALTGMRYEEKTQTFDPAKHVSLARAQNPALFEVFLNLAARQKTIEETRT